MASTFTDENIDPNLLALDPTNDILARIHNNRTTPLIHLQRFPLAMAMTASSLVAYGRLVKHKITLSDTSSVAFDQFCQTSLATCAHSPVTQSIQENDKGEVWTIPDGLMKKISSYVKAFVFSPTTTSYRGLNVSEHIMQAMCECKVNGLPEEDDLIAVDLFLARIRD
ncbi:hypothetical protein B0H10DRAFT_2218346 [Mycena sp. CBHHK59/15]|nr:hypothetical protein B0H10DRAFT_2218346 [Mycena sp. CBHHK59/15]